MSRVQCELGSSRRRRPWRSDPRLLKLALGTWNVTCLLGKEPELVHKAERFWLDIVGLPLMHGLGSGTSLLEMGWTLFHSGVARGERRRADVGLLIAPRVCLHVGVYPGGRESSLPPPSGGGTGPDCCLCLHIKQQFRVPTLFGVPGGECSYRRLPSSAGELQCSRGQ